MVKMSLPERNVLTWGSRDELATARAQRIAIDSVVAGIKASTGATQVEVRPVMYTDLGLTGTTDPFINYAASAGANSILPANFTVPNGKAYAFFGLRDLTAGTKSLFGFQMTIQGTNYPLAPIPLYHAWVDEENTVFFSPLKATSPASSMSITLYSINAQNVSFQLIGFVAQPLSATSR